MNDIKTIGKKFAKYLVDLNADSFRQQIEDIIKAEQFKAYHFGQNALYREMPILKKYEPIDCFFKDLDSTWFSCQLVLKISIAVVLGFRDTAQQNEKKVDGEYWLKLSYFGSIDFSQETCFIDYQTLYYSEDEYIKEAELLPEIIPYLSEEELDDFAQSFLCKYATDMLTTPMPLSVQEVARQLGLQVYLADLPDNVLGQMCFTTRKAKVFDEKENDFIEQSVPRRSILIKYRKGGVNLLHNFNFSVIHECMHWERHRKFIDMCLLIDKHEFETIECPVMLERGQRLSSDNKRMEWQANNLAARILVPTITAKEKFADLLQEIRQQQPTWRNALVMEEAVKRLARIYHVSYETAQYRAIQFGYGQVAGVLNYLDGTFTLPISFKKGALAPGQSFFAPDAEIEQVLKQKDLAEAYAHRLIVHVNKMLVLNQSQYVIQCDDGHYELTDYALEHADECCLVFDVKCISAIPNAYYCDTTVLNRDFMADDFKEVMCDTRTKQNHDILKNADQGQEIKEQLEEYLAFYKTLPSDFGGTLKAHRNRKWNEIKELIKEPDSDYNNLTQEHLAERSMVSQGAIESYEGGDAENIKLGTVLSICASLRLHPLFMIDLIQKAGYNLFNGSLANAFYLYLIFYHHMESVEDWNLKLRRAGLSQLLPKRSDEVCEKLEEMLAELEKWEEENKK